VKPKSTVLVIFLSLSTGAVSTAAEIGLPFIRGDANGSGDVNITDPVFVLRYFFASGAAPGCDDACDATDDGRLTITDSIFLLRYLFSGGPAPYDPSGACGLDPTEDSLGCAESGSCPVEIPCVSEDDVNALLGGSIETELCLPAGILNVPADPLTISVCPSDKAAPCGVLESPGCPVRLTKIAARIDVAGSRIVIPIEGRMDDLPVDIEAAIVGTTTCATDFHGETADLPFSLDLVVPLVLEEKAPGDYEITGIGDMTIEDVSLRLTASGGLVCTLFQAGQDALIAPLIGILEETLKGLTAGLPAELQGLRVCAGDGA